jgi:hypothetical protein
VRPRRRTPAGAALLAALLLVLTAAPLAAQGSERCASRGYRRATRAAAGTVFVGANAGLYEYFRRAWWSGERSDFFVQNDWDGHFRDQDKFGHLLGGFHLATGGRALLEAACVGPTRAAIWGAAYAAAFQLQIEIWDGYQARYGFSPADLVANTAGAGLALGHHAFPRTRAVIPTFSYARTAALRNVDRTASDLRPTVDYSGQTYWFSADVDELLPAAAKPYWPGILRLSVGHSITDWVDPATGEYVRAKRKLLLSLDVDPRKLPGDHPAWRAVKNALAYYHFPSPALQITPSVRGITWYR